MDLKKLLLIQQEVNGEKSLYNSFSKFNYRNVEGILKDLKPLLAKTGTVIHFNDGICASDGWHYISATASLMDAESGEIIAQSTAYAREAESRKGMDSSQITGSASSYARKYAISALLALSPAPDADEFPPETARTPNGLDSMKAILRGKKIPIEDFCMKVFKKGSKHLSKKQIDSFLNRPDAAIEVYRELSNEG